MTDTETKPPIFPNPYPDFDYSTKESRRVHAEVSSADYLLVKLIRPDMGTIKYTVGLLWKQLCYELRSRNITDITSAKQFESLITSFRIVPNSEYERLLLLDSASRNASRDSTEANGTNVGGRTPGVPTRSANEQGQQSNLPRKRGSKSGTSPGKGEKERNG